MADPRLTEAVAHVRAAIERLHDAVGDPDETRRRVASVLDETPETLRDAPEALANAVRRRPLMALALAFGAGLALAALTRG